MLALTLVLGSSGPSVAAVAFGHASLSPPAMDAPDPTPSVQQRPDPAGSSSDDPASRAPLDTPLGTDRPDGLTAPAGALGVAPLRKEFPAYPVVSNERVQHFVDRFTGVHRKVIGLWLERSSHYLGMVRSTLRRFGLPEDLAFTAMIESGFNPVAVSRAGAKGLWQFMAQTARIYGLRVDSWVDERLDPEKSTVAAAAYLRDLYNQFGSWFLAQAAYNAGEVAVARAIKLGRTNDFWELARSHRLRDETRDFVPAIQAITMIGRDPDRYGFEIAAYESPRLETVRVPPSTDLRTLSRSTGLRPDALQALNPELWRSVTPPGAFYTLKVPGEARDRVLVALLSTGPAGPRHVVAKVGRVHIVRRHETVSGIAKRYGVSVKDIVRWNRLTRQDRIHPGDRIRLANVLASRGQVEEGGFR